MDHRDQLGLDRARHLAELLAETDAGPAGELAGELADEVAALAARVEGLSARVDALWQLISAVVKAAGLSAPETGAPPPEFVQALERARTSGRRGVRLNIDGREWVAALSQQPPAPDPASWSAIERLAKQAGDLPDQDDR
jgi:hypothetical protein